MKDPALQAAKFNKHIDAAMDVLPEMREKLEPMKKVIEARVEDVGPYARKQTVKVKE